MRVMRSAGTARTGARRGGWTSWAGAARIGAGLVAALVTLSTLAVLVMLVPFTAPAAFAEEPSESAPAETADPDPPPPGVERLLRRGGIPAVFEPVFVSGQEARLPDDAMVLGVAIDGDAHAYSLNLLNQHEVVNDRIGEFHFAAVW